MVLAFIGWKVDGKFVDYLEGYNVEDYFTAEGDYLGPDCDGVEPVFDLVG